MGLDPSQSPFCCVFFISFSTADLFEGRICEAKEEVNDIFKRN